eukprot:TRINITY_DN19721_c0_g1_i1.p1 TRINITY_DN19721_c0_g1~~TRINITY_DN19721_c0_g1_i1.p1  ORF type:complete len:626 (+),score=217.20 TRINITY_DN19721_c0_g1_i1:97-1974(+)
MFSWGGFGVPQQITDWIGAGRPARETETAVAPAVVNAFQKLSEDGTVDLNDDGDDFQSCCSDSEGRDRPPSPRVAEREVRWRRECDMFGRSPRDPGAEWRVLVEGATLSIVREPAHEEASRPTWFLMVESSTGHRLVRSPVGDSQQIIPDYDHGRIYVQASSGTLMGGIAEFSLGFKRPPGEAPEKAVREFEFQHCSAFYDWATGGTEREYEPTAEEHEPQRGGSLPLEADWSASDELAAMSSQELRRDGLNVAYADSGHHGKMLVVRDEGERTVLDSIGTSEDGTHFSQHGSAESVFELAAGKEVKGRRYLRPDSLIMHPSGGHKLLALDREHRSGMFEVDVGKGRATVVQEYDPQPDVPLELHAVLPQKKGREGHLVTTMVKNATFAVDTRAHGKGSVVVGLGSEEPYINKYICRFGGRRTVFSCHAVSGDGKLVVGDSCGTIRLYSGTPGVGKAPARSKNNLLAAGGAKPVLHVDITKDGRYVLATFDRWLHFQDISIDGQQKTGCEVAFKGGKKPHVELRVPLAHQAQWGVQDAIFTCARFDSCPETEETRIVACLGHLIVGWKVADVRQKGSAAGFTCSHRAVGNGQDREDLVVDASARPDQLRWVTRKRVGMALPAPME